MVLIHKFFPQIMLSTLILNCISFFKCNAPIPMYPPSIPLSVPKIIKICHVSLTYFFFTFAINKIHFSILIIQPVGRCWVSSYSENPVSRKDMIVSWAISLNEFSLSHHCHVITSSLSFGGERGQHLHVVPSKLVLAFGQPGQGSLWLALLMWPEG